MSDKQPLPCQEAYRLMQENAAVLIDVRGYDEYARGRAGGAKCIPLPELEKRLAEIPVGATVCVMCASGARSAIAVERLHALGMNRATSLKGGYQEWKAAGLPIEETKGIIPLEQQVRGVAGFLVFAFTLASLLLNKWFAAGSLFVGFMLFLSSVTGWCPMLILLKIMPWNRVPSSKPSA